MPAAQQISSPPKMDHPAPPWFHKLWDQLCRYVVGIRPVAGDNISIVDAPGGGLQINAHINKRRRDFLEPFEVVPYLDTATGIGNVYVNLNSWLLQNADPTTKITITGLGKDNYFPLLAGHMIWLDIDLSATYDEGGGDITASIEHGEHWGLGGGEAFYPLPVSYDTDDGTRLSSSGTPPDNAKQVEIYIPIGYAIAKGADEFGIIDAGEAWNLYDDVYFIQQLRSNLVLGTACIDSGNVRFALPSSYAPQQTS